MIPFFVMLAAVLAARAAGAFGVAWLPPALRLPLQLLGIGLLLWIALGATAARVAG